MDRSEGITIEQGMAHLNRDGDLAVPCSRYGSSTYECSPVAWAVAHIIEHETGEPMTLDSLDHIMGLVVNDHDDVDHIIEQYGRGDFLATYPDTAALED